MINISSIFVQYKWSFALKKQSKTRRNFQLGRKEENEGEKIVKMVGSEEETEDH